MPSKSAIYVQTSALRALTTILRSVGPVISTRLSIRPGAGGAPFHASFSLTCFVSGRKPGRAPLSSSTCLITRRWRRLFLVALKDRWRRARKATASLVKMSLCVSLIVPVMSTPWMIASIAAIVEYSVTSIAITKKPEIGIDPRGETGVYMRGT